MIQIKQKKSINDIFGITFNNAAHSFSILVGQEMFIDEYLIEMMTGEAFIDRIMDDMESSYFVSIMRIHEKMDCTIVFLITKQEGLELYDAINENNKNGNNEVSEEVIASIGELNNILGSTFINCLANTLQNTIYGTIPLNTFDMLGAILESIVLQNEFLNKELLCADAIICEKEKARFHIRLMIMSDKDQLINLIEEQ
jgi:chemotaxis protein CheY-P-specific phosphatase CheC